MGIHDDHLLLVGWVQVEKGAECGVVCSADRCGVGSVCVHGVAGDTSGISWVPLNENESYRLFRDMRLHIWPGGHNAVPGRTGRAPVPETSIQLPPATSVCAGSDGRGGGETGSRRGEHSPPI